MIYLIEYKNEKMKINYEIEIEAEDKKEAIKKVSKKVGIKNIINIYLKLN